VSCKTWSKELLLRIIPVSPPTVNKIKNPWAHNIGISLKDFLLIPHIVAIHEKIFTPVGTAIVIVTLVK